MTLSYILGDVARPPDPMTKPGDWSEFVRCYINDNGDLRVFLRKLWKLYGDRLTAIEAFDATLGTIATKNVPLDEAYGGTSKTTMPIPFSLEFYATNATAAGSSYYGYLNSVDTTSALAVPTGTTMKVLMATVYAKTGGAAGTFSIAPILYNVTDGAATLLSAYATGAAATNIYTNNKGTLASPITTLAAGKRFLVGWQNRASSPGTLDAAAQHHVIVSGYFTV